MRQSEYEGHKRALEAQFQADVELMRASYQARLRALETLWIAAPEEALTVPETLSLGETLPAGETLRQEPASEPVMVQRGHLSDDLAEIFPQLPEVFDKWDAVRALGYEPPRATLYRMLSQLVREGRIAMARHSDGHSPTRYRKLPPPLEAGADLG